MSRLSSLSISGSDSLPEDAPCPASPLARAGSEPSGEQLAEIATLITDGTVLPILDSTFPLDEVAAAYAHARSGEANGKVAIAIR